MDRRKIKPLITAGVIVIGAAVPPDFDNDRDRELPPKVAYAQAFSSSSSTSVTATYQFGMVGNTIEGEDFYCLPYYPYRPAAMVEIVFPSPDPAPVVLAFSSSSGGSVVVWRST